MPDEGRGPNNSLLFSPDSDMDLLFAVLALVVLLALTVGPALAELSEVRLDLALLLLALAGLPAVANLLRYKRAPWGCAVIPAGFLLYGLAYAIGRSGVEGTLLLAAPNVAFLFWQVALRPGLERARAAQALQAVAEARDASSLLPFLTHPAPRVATAAAEAIGQRPAEALPLLRQLLRGEDEAAAAVAARILPVVDGEGGELALASEDPRPQVRLALAGGLLVHGRDPALTSQLLVDALGSALPKVRVAALDTTDLPSAPEEHRRTLHPALCDALRARLSGEEPVTAELLWALAEHGGGRDAPLAARHVSSDQLEVANAAVEAIWGILGRGDLGAASQETLSALATAREALRGEHTEGENPLADRLVGRIEGLELRLSG